MSNYTKLESKYIDEIQSKVTIYVHNKTGARIATFDCEDNNKVFSISFRTPPKDSTGLTHILEHSVLCGSKKFPVKDPFVELLKSSLNTFLNAFTFPDKTMYPLASQNLNDFKNLMSVYMDAVFYPQIYNHEEIFMQEGWHYHITDENEPITYNGVVYNEMKGAFSDPQQILIREIIHSLFPDNAYGFESGGDPKYIPDLTYDDFKEFHSKYYHPSNSYIMLYGNLDMEERLAWLDEEYLSKFDRIEFDTTIKYQKSFDAPVLLTNYYPVDKEEDLNDKTFLSYNLVLPSTLDNKLIIAMSILTTALFETPGAPLRQKLIDANLGADVQTMFDDGLLQPLLSIIVLNSNIDKEEAFVNLINEALKEIINKGLDKEELLSLINYFEFKLREKAFSPRMPQGLDFQIQCLSSWLYDDNHPFDKLEVLKYYKEFKNDLNNGYFENIISEYILNNNHKSYVKLVPSHTCKDDSDLELVNKLKAYKESLSKEELVSLINKNKALEAYQSTPSTNEEIDTLPKLKLEDINKDIEDLKLKVIDDKYKKLISNYHTNEISYIKYYFDLSNIAFDDVLYLSLYIDLFKELSTENYTYQNINKNIRNITGGFSVALQNFKTIDLQSKVFLVFSYSALTENVSKANDILVDIINNTIYDEKRIFEKISEIKANIENTLASRGHQTALTRALSYIDENGKYKDNLGGISYCDFINNIYKNYNDCKEAIIDRLKHVKDLLSKKNFIFGFTGLDDMLNSNIDVFDSFYDSLNDELNYNKNNFKVDKLNEGFKTQANVNFVARCGRFTDTPSGALLVLNNALSMDYLWTNVRVLGGAYGCMMQADVSGILGFTSYRDPNISKTNDAYNNIIDFINNFNPNEDELLKYKIGAIGGLDVVAHVKDKAESARLNYFRKYTYEMRKKYREEAINATNEDIRALAKSIKEALDDDCICVIGNASMIENEDLFKNVRNLGK